MLPLPLRCYLLGEVLAHHRRRRGDVRCRFGLPHLTVGLGVVHLSLFEGRELFFDVRVEPPDALQLVRVIGGAVVSCILVELVADVVHEFLDLLLVRRDHPVERVDDVVVDELGGRLGELNADGLEDFHDMYILLSYPATGAAGEARARAPGALAQGSAAPSVTDRALGDTVRNHAEGTSAPWGGEGARDSAERIGGPAPENLSMKI